MQGFATGFRRGIGITLLSLLLTGCFERGKTSGEARRTGSASGRPTGQSVPTPSPTPTATPSPTPTATPYAYSPGSLAPQHDVADGCSRFAANLYRVVLGRSPSSSEVAYWRDQIQRSSPRAVALQFLFVPESLRRLVDSMYRKFLRRPGDPSGLDYFVRILTEGTPERDVVVSFLVAPEYTNRQLSLYPTPVGTAADPATRAFVTGLYKDLFDRLPIASEVDYWASRLASGAMTKNAVALVFLGTQEWQNRFAAQLYVDYLGRKPEPGGAEGHGARMVLRSPIYASVFTDERLLFLDSDEFQRERCYSPEWLLMPTSDGNLYLGLTYGGRMDIATAFPANPYLGPIYSGAGTSRNFAADVSGDGLPDLVSTLPNGHLYVAKSSASRRYLSLDAFWHEQFAPAFVKKDESTRFLFLDVNGDGRKEMVSLNAGGAGYVFHFTGQQFQLKDLFYRPDLGPLFARDSGWRVMTGDFNGDRFEDLALVGSDGTDGIVLAGFSNGVALTFVEAMRVPGWSGLGRDWPGRWFARDFNGDRRTDLAFTWSDGTVHTLLSDGARFNPVLAYQNDAFKGVFDGRQPVARMFAEDFRGLGEAQLTFLANDGNVWTSKRLDATRWDFELIEQTPPWASVFNALSVGRFLAAELNGDKRREVRFLWPDGNTYRITPGSAADGWVHEGATFLGAGYDTRYTGLQLFPSSSTIQPRIVESFTAAPIGYHEVALQWATANVQHAEGLIVRYSTDAATWSLLAKLAPEETSFRHPGLPAGTHYYSIQLVGNHGNESSRVAFAQARLLPPPTPTPVPTEPPPPTPTPPPTEGGRFQPPADFQIGTGEMMGPYVIAGPGYAASIFMPKLRSGYECVRPAILLYNGTGGWGSCNPALATAASTSYYGKYGLAFASVCGLTTAQGAKIDVMLQTWLTGAMAARDRMVSLGAVGSALAAYGTSSGGHMTYALHEINAFKFSWGIAGPTDLVSLYTYAVPNDAALKARYGISLKGAIEAAFTSNPTFQATYSPARRPASRNRTLITYATQDALVPWWQAAFTILPPYYPPLSLPRPANAVAYYEARVARGLSTGLLPFFGDHGYVSTSELNRINEAIRAEITDHYLEPLWGEMSANCPH